MCGLEKGERRALDYCMLPAEPQGDKPLVARSSFLCVEERREQLARAPGWYNNTATWKLRSPALRIRGRPHGIWQGSQLTVAVSLL